MMRFRRLQFLAFLSLAVLVAQARVSAQTTLNDSSLVGVTGFLVAVYPAASLSAADTFALRTMAELAVRRLGVPVLQRIDPSQAFAAAALIVDLQLLDRKSPDGTQDGYSYYLQLQVAQSTYTPRRASKGFPAVTWFSRGVIGTIGRAVDLNETLTNGLRRELEQFSNAFLAVNPPH